MCSSTVVPDGFGYHHSRCGFSDPGCAAAGLSSRAPRNIRHDSLRDVFLTIVKSECHLRAIGEVDLRPGIASDMRRMDVVIEDHPRFGTSSWIDFGVTCPIPETFQIGTHLSRAASPGVATSLYARAKHSTYQDLFAPSVGFTPAICDIFGYWHEPFVHFVRELAARVVSSSASAAVTDHNSLPLESISKQLAARLQHRWMQRLGVSLQRDQAKQILIMAGARDQIQSPFRSTQFDGLIPSDLVTRR